MPVRISLLAAVEMLKAAWMELTAECIANCFRKAGFMGPGTEDAIDHPQEGRSHEDLWQRVVDTQLAGPDVAWDDFVSADDDTDIAEPCTDEAIVREVRALPDCPETDEDDDEDAALPPVAVNASTAIGYIASLKELVCSRGPRRQYSAAFKRKVISAAETIGNCAAERQFDVNERSIRGWRNQKEALFACSGQRKSFPEPKNGAFPEVERELTVFVRKQRAAHLAVNIELLQAKAREIARDKGIQRADFKASKHWVSRFMRRAGFSLRRRTSISQKLPESYEELLVAFQKHVISLRKAVPFQLGQIGNADQMPVYLDMPSALTVHQKGSRQVTVRSTGNEKTRVTVMLSCTADGRKLPPYVVFKRKTLPKGEKFPKNVVIRCQDKGWMDESLVLDWI
ncbi:tigger transposable element-derived protein 6-like [Ixodes scapularis]